MNVHASRYQFRVGLFSIGLEAYWPQFDGLKEKLTSYNQRIAEKLESAGAPVVNLGLIDTPEKAVTAGHRFREADVDLIFLHVSTYAVSSTVLPVVRRAKVPVIILNLAPGAAIDYSSFNEMRDRRRMTGEWLKLVPGLRGSRDCECFPPLPGSFFSSHRDTGRRPRGVERDFGMAAGGPCR